MPLSTFSAGSMLGVVVDFFNHLNMLYGTITEFCTPETVRPLPRSPTYQSLALWVSVSLSRLISLSVVPDYVRWTKVHLSPRCLPIRTPAAAS
jgi:hypothetical protein